jgi:hypothetical protein
MILNRAKAIKTSSSELGAFLVDAIEQPVRLSGTRNFGLKHGHFDALENRAHCAWSV